MSDKETKGAFAKLVVASEAVAFTQPAAHAKDQADADAWGRFYEAVNDARKVLDESPR